MPPLPLEALRGLMGRLVALGLVHGLWIGLLAASAAALALRIVPHRWRRVRYGLLLGALGAVALGPPLATAFQRARAGSREAGPAIVAAADIVVIPGRADVVPAGARDAVPQAPAPAEEATPPGMRAVPITVRAATAFDAAQPFILAAWMLVAVPLLAFLAFGFRATGALRRGAVPAAATIRARSDRLARGLGLRRAPPVLVHPDLAAPCLCGLIRPAILLPGRWLPGADDDRLDAILAHELAHARRFDLPVNFAQRLVEALLFFNPAVHWLSRSIRRQRELCADAMAVSLTGDPLALARALESVARLHPSCRPSMHLGAPLGGDDLSLLPRIQELFGMTPSRPKGRLWPLAATPAAVLVALLSASLGWAQDPPSPRLPPMPSTHPPPKGRGPRPRSGRSPTTFASSRSALISGATG